MTDHAREGTRRPRTRPPQAARYPSSARRRRLRVLGLGVRLVGLAVEEEEEEDDDEEPEEPSELAAFVSAPLSDEEFSALDSRWRLRVP